MNGYTIPSTSMTPFGSFRDLIGNQQASNGFASSLINNAWGNPFSSNISKNSTKNMSLVANSPHMQKFNDFSKSLALSKLNSSMGQNIMTTNDLYALRPVSNAQAQANALARGLPNTNGGLWDSIKGGLGKFDTFMNSSAGKGLMGGVGLASGLFDMYKGWQAHKANMKNMQLMRDIQNWEWNKTKGEYDRLKGQRKDITNSYQNGKVI